MQRFNDLTSQKSLGCGVERHILGPVVGNIATNLSIGIEILAQPS